MRVIKSAIVIAMAVSVSFHSCDGADFSDDFESYSLGDIHAQGPWLEFGGFEGSPLRSDVSTAQALSGTQSLALSNNVGGGIGSDSYIENLIGGVPRTSGIWNVSYSTYFPSNFDGAAYLYHSKGVIPNTFERGIWMRLNGTSSNFEFLGSQPETAALVLDRWAEIDLLIDLDNNTVDVSYDGSLVHSGPWDNDNPGTPAMGGLNVWASDGTAQGTYFIDDLSVTRVVPEPSTIALCALGLIGLAMRRKLR